MECSHDKTEIRYFVQCNKVIQYRHQCLICGEHLKTFKKKNIDLSIKYKEFDKGIILRWREKGKEKYREYLGSTEWKIKRKQVFDRDVHLCQRCLSCYASEVHHLTYANIFHEELSELVSLCTKCHKIIHNKQ